MRRIFSVLHCAGIAYLDLTYQNLMFVEHTNSLVLMDFDTVRIIARPIPEMCNSTALAHQVWMRPAIDKNHLPRSPPNFGGVDDAVNVILRECMNSEGDLRTSPLSRSYANTRGKQRNRAVSTERGQQLSRWWLYM